MLHAGGSRYSQSSCPSSHTTSVCGNLPSLTHPTMTAAELSTPQSVSSVSPPQAYSWAHQASQYMGQAYYATSGSTYPPPSPLTGVNPNNRGTIIYPEFVNHLVHPDVDSFKDIPKLPGQKDPSPSATSSFSSTNTCGPLAQTSSQSPPSYAIYHSPVHVESKSPVDLSEEDLEQILELNKDSMYS